MTAKNTSKALNEKLLCVLLATGILIGIFTSAVVLTGAGEENRQNLKEDLTDKKVALTYDDGPDPRYTKELLQVLDQYQVKATFFVLGEAVDANPKLVKQMSQQGHMIGNHTYSHVNLGQMSVEEGEQQISKTNEAIFQATGEYPILFRPPFGNFPESLEDKSKLFFVLWDVDPLDWKCQNTDMICREVMKNIRENDIILMHDAYETTVEATKRLIPALKKEGYEFVTVDELLLE